MADRDSESWVPGPAGRLALNHIVCPWTKTFEASSPHLQARKVGSAHRYTKDMGHTGSLPSPSYTNV